LTLIPPAWVGADEATQLARRGVERFQAEDYEAARQAFEEAAGLDPTSPALQYNLGTTLARQQRFGEAAEALARSTSLPEHPTRRDAFYNLGLSRVEAARALEPSALEPRLEGLRRGLEAFRAALIADPSDGDAKRNYELTQRWIAELEEQLRREAEAQGQGESDSENERSQNDQENAQGENPSRGEKPEGEDAAEQPPSEESSPTDERTGESSENQPDASESGRQEPSEAGQEPPAPGEGTEQPAEPSEPSEDSQGHASPAESRQRAGLEATPTPAPAAATPPAVPPVKPGEPATESTPLSPGQIDALRVLNALEEARPESFRRLFQFRGAAPSRRPEKDW